MHHREEADLLGRLITRGVRVVEIEAVRVGVAGRELDVDRSNATLDVGISDVHAGETRCALEHLERSSVVGCAVSAEDSLSTREGAAVVPIDGSQFAERTDARLFNVRTGLGRLVVGVVGLLEFIGERVHDPGLVDIVHRLEFGGHLTILSDLGELPFATEAYT